MHVELDVVEPFLAMGEFLNRQRIHWLDEPNLDRRERIEILVISERSGGSDSVQRLT